ncbi:hypothetical protein FOA43_001797 [Brettanomyces nanus]|uniref:chitin synthase n=1 Tax=Eeniella nana TaxID=13502 RepID=A0A875RUD8_EENNA|nr:uncharacterized protein FOA43_001797 [Brettanomyces nanus]QPG74467.1 hypothetical protein FOA43_001797 [Brettanomyces nanus]
MSRPLQSPFDFDDSDNESINVHDSTSEGPFASPDDYNMNSWSRTNRRLPPEVQAALPVGLQAGFPVGLQTGSPVGPQMDLHFTPSLLSPPQTHSVDKYGNDYSQSYNFDDYYSTNDVDEAVRPTESSTKIRDLPSRPVNYSSSGFFQAFERDPDEPEIDYQPSLIEDEKQQLPETTNAPVNVAGTERVKLLNGRYYSFDYPVPKLLLENIPFEGAKDLAEFTYLRYHAITADPKDYRPDNSVARDFIENYPLRQKCYPIPRETELMIVCTMYNEDEILLARTLKGVFKNIKHMYNMFDDPDSPFGRSAWKKIVVVVVADGRNKLNERSKSLLTLLGCYQDGIIQEKVNDVDVKAHLFEYTTSFGIGKFKYDSKGGSRCRIPLVTDQTIPIQFMFLLKEKNAQKINSHRWALNFLCPNLNPKVVCLIDVGTEPGPDSIYKLWEAFKDPQVGGVCGEIRAMLGRHASANDETALFGKIAFWIWAKMSDLWACFCNPLVAAQNFEYKISNILDKPTESFYGFVTVLPGAFSAYRYTALQGDPLEAYFHGEDMKSDTEKPAGVLESNMYLAEDRILCYQLVSKPYSSFLLRYVHDSYAVTDVPSSVDEFMAQRRRWLNGSFFAALYSLIHFYRILRCSHSWGRKMLLVLEMSYQFISIIISWFALATYFLIFRILTLEVISTTIGFKVGNILAVVFLWIYITAAALTFIISFGNKPNQNKRLYQLVFALFGIVGIYMMFCVILLTISAIDSIKDAVSSSKTSLAVTLFKNSTFRNLTVSLASTYLLYLLSSLLFFDVFHLIACTIPYLLLNPAYVNVLSIYAFCNLDDISWGTKGALKSEESPKKQASVVNASGSSVEQELLLSEALQDPDEMYLQARKELESLDDGNKDINASNLKLSQKNYAKGRTYAVLIWLFSNFILLVVVLRTGGLDEYINIQDDGPPGSTTTTSTTATASATTTSTTTKRFVKREYDEHTASIFMTVILWIVVAMALFRFLGCIFYRLDFFRKRQKYHKAQVYY